MEDEMMMMMIMDKKKQSSGFSAQSPTNSPSVKAMQKESRTIAKVKPKIRIIHIFAPEIIKTDVANFRELVQRLTGKPADHHQENSNAKKIPTNQEKQSAFKKTEAGAGVGESERMTIKGEEEIWNNGVNNSSSEGGGFLGGFAELEGFMQELNGFQFLPLDGFGETAQIA